MRKQKEKEVGNPSLNVPYTFSFSNLSTDYRYNGSVNSRQMDSAIKHTLNIFEYTGLRSPSKENSNFKLYHYFEIRDAITLSLFHYLFKFLITYTKNIGCLKFKHYT